MDFDVVLTAKSTDEGGLKASIDRQLAELGGTSTLVSTVGPYRVDSSDGDHFEIQQSYHIVLT